MRGSDHFSPLRVQVIEMPGQSSDRAAKARAALRRKIELEIGSSDPVKIEAALREHYREMQRRSVRRRRIKRAQRAAQTAAELRRAGYDVASIDDLLAAARSQVKR
jgi:hypothetical protein